MEVCRKLGVIFLLLSILLTGFQCEEYTTTSPLQPHSMMGTFYIENMSHDLTIYVILAFHRFGPIADPPIKLMTIPPRTTSQPYPIRFDHKATHPHYFFIEFGASDTNAVYRTPVFRCDIESNDGDAAKMLISYEEGKIMIKKSDPSNHCSVKFEKDPLKVTGRIVMENMSPYDDVTLKSFYYANDTVATNKVIEAHTMLDPFYTVIPEKPHHFNMMFENRFSPYACTTGEFQCDVEGDEMFVQVDMKNSKVIMRRRTKPDCVRTMMCPYGIKEPIISGSDISPYLLGTSPISLPLTSRSGCDHFHHEHEMHERLPHLNINFMPYPYH